MAVRDEDERLSKIEAEKPRRSPRGRRCSFSTSMRFDSKFTQSLLSSVRPSASVQVAQQFARDDEQRQSKIGASSGAAAEPIVQLKSDLVEP